MSIAQNFPALKPSLLLDFANVKKLDPRISFSRASGATYYDGVTTAKAEENLLRYSQEFDNAAWLVPSLGGAVSVSVNTSVAPDGTLTADRLNFDTVFQAIGQSVFVPNKQNTFSIWLKIDTGTRELSLVEATGAIVATFVVTDQWVRYSATFTPTQNTVGLQDRNGSGFVGVDVWGAQLEQRSAPTAYTPTTTQPITNYIPVLQTASANVARFDHDPVTSESLGLLVEEQRTNLLLRSEEFDNAAWSKFRSNVESNAVTAPDGTLTADKLIQGVGETTTGGVQTNITTSAVPYTYSVYAKAGEYGGVILRKVTGTPVGIVAFNLVNGTVTRETLTNNGTSIVHIGNGWYRCSVTFTASSGSESYSVQVTNEAGDELGLISGDGYSGIYIWGAQLEAGAFPTSYIKTEASQVTRSADSASMTGANFSEWYRQDEGTLYCESQTNQANASNVPRRFFISDGTTSNNINLNNGASGFQGGVSVNGSVQASFAIGSYSSNSTKQSIAYRVNDFNCATNGTASTTDTSGTLPVVDRVHFGSAPSANYLNGHIKKIAFYQKRLTDTELQALTS